MPRFLLSIFILALVSLVGFGFVVLKTSPDRTVSVVLFLATLFLGLTFSLSLVFFFLRKKFFFTPHFFPLKKGAGFNPVFTDPAGGWSSSGRDAELRPLFRTALRRAVLLAALLTAILVLQRLR